jgi:hypothetical protein
LGSFKSFGVKVEGAGNIPIGKAEVVGWPGFTGKGRLARAGDIIAVCLVFVKGREF